jgi:hypothetical protein
MVARHGLSLPLSRTINVGSSMGASASASPYAEANSICSNYLLGLFARTVPA